MRTLRHSSSQTGLTLVEIMIAMVILGFAIAAAFALSYSLLGGFTDSARVLQVQNGARGGVDLIADAIRASSPGVTSGALADLANCTGQTDAIQVDNDEGTANTDAITIMHAAGGVVGFLQADVLTSSDTITVNAENAEFQERMFFEEGDLLILANGTEGHLVRVAGVGSGPTDSSPTADWVLKLDDQVGNLCGGLAMGMAPFTNAAPEDRYPAGTLVLRARMSRFAVCTVGTTPYLILGDLDEDCDATEDDFEPVAEGIEDLQIAVGIDVDDNDSLDEVAAAADDDEIFYNVAGDSAPTNLSAVPRWLAVRITLVARTTDEASGENASNRPAVEDHAAGTADVYRRRSLSTVLELRNIDN